MHGRGPYCIRNGLLDLEISLLPQPKRKPCSPEEANKRVVLLKSNISHWYNSLLAAMTGGKTLRLTGSEINRRARGEEERKFRPDIVKMTRHGMLCLETKAASFRNAKFHCAERQLENYVNKLLERIERGDVAPRCDYAFFTYGERGDMGFGKLSNEELEQVLHEKTNSLLLMPMNLALLLFMSSERYSHDQTTSGGGLENQSYFYARSGFLTALLNGREGIGKLVDHNYLRFQPEWVSSDDFFVKQTKLVKSESPRIRVNGKPVKKFDITQYYLPNGEYKRWLKHFSENHEKILQTIGIRDLYAETIEATRNEGCSD